MAHMAQQRRTALALPSRSGIESPAMHTCTTMHAIDWFSTVIGLEHGGDRTISDTCTGGSRHQDLAGGMDLQSMKQPELYEF